MASFKLGTEEHNEELPVVGCLLGWFVLLLLCWLLGGAFCNQ